MSVDPSPLSFMGVMKLVRFPNLIMIGINQYLATMYLLGKGLEATIQDIGLHLTVGSTLLIAAAGYFINDYYDIKIDLINKPDKVIVGQNLKRRPIMVLHILMNLLGFILGMTVSWKVGIINALSSLCLWYYSNQMKRWPFIGNLAIGWLVAMSLLLVGVRYGSYTKLLIVYCFFAFMMTIIREILKDIEDQKGDQTFGCYTLPIAIGLRKTKSVIYLLIGVFVFGLMAFLSRINSSTLILYFGGLSLPFIFFVIKLIRADAKKHFSQLSLLAKLIMFSGIISMIFV